MAKKSLIAKAKRTEATSSLESGITIEPDELSAWTELLKLKLIGDANFDLRSFCSEIELQYPELSSVHYLRNNFV